MPENEVERLAGDLAKLGEAAVSGDVKAALSAFDDDQDGRISFHELRRHRLTILVIFLCMVSGMIGYLVDHWDLVVGHWRALVSIGVSFALGFFFAALFLPYHLTVGIVPTEVEEENSEA